jgi:hypothetical protein
VIKIDVENHEINVILGMQEIIKNNFVVLQVEINDGDVQRVAKCLNPLGVNLVHSIGQDYYFVKA